MELYGYMAAVLMGVTLGLIGGGGSILTVPILVYIFNMSPVLATGYSLFIVGITALIGALAYVKKSLIDYRTGVTFAIPSFAGVYLARSYLVPSLPEQITQFGGFVLTKPIFIMAVFAILMVAASFSMIKSGRDSASKSKKEISPALRYSIIGAEGLIVGAVTGFVGAGGGFLIIPALVILAGLSMKIAVGTSLMIIAVKSLIGFLGDLQAGVAADWGFLLSLSATSVVGIVIGSILSKHVPEGKLKKSFGWFVLVMGSFILIEQLRKM